MEGGEYSFGKGETDALHLFEVVGRGPGHAGGGPEGVQKGRTAPWVVAKGVDAVAQRIKAVAAEHEIVLYEDVPLARALHKQVEIGDQIPEGYYEAVAAVLAYVYRVKGLAPVAQDN